MAINPQINPTTGLPQTYVFSSAIGNMINRNQGAYQDPFYGMPYGLYGAQFPNLGTQIGAAMYSNVQPRQYTPNWTVDRMPPRLGMRDTGEADPFSPYITGRQMGNYGQLFSKFGAAPQGPFGITPTGGSQQGPFGGGAYQNLTQPFNPYPLYAPYDPSKSLNVRTGYNPFLRNQAGTPSVGLTGAGGSVYTGLQPPPGSVAPSSAPPPGVTTKSAGGGAAPPPSGGGLDIQPGSVPGPGGVYIDPTDPNGVINLPQSAGQSSLQSIMSYLQSNPQLRGLLGF
jgi:hypothetical protein